MVNSLKHVIEQVSKEKDLKPEVIIEALESAMVIAAKRYFRSSEELKARFNPINGNIEIFAVKKVVKRVKNPDLEISLREAQKENASLEVGDFVEISKPTEGLGRISAQVAKQVIIQQVREAERKKVYAKYVEKLNELIVGTVRRREGEDIIFDINGESEALLERKESVFKEEYNRGERMRLLLIRVRETRDPQLIVSRKNTEFIRRLFEIEVPEIHDGIVIIKNIVRIPGERTKISVYSKDSDVDPIGACVGVKGSRINNIIKELRGERVDIVQYDDDPANYVVNALNPAEILRVLILDPFEKKMEVIVSDENLSLAIGKRGQNVKLAGKLIGWDVKIKSESEKKDEINREILSEGSN